MNLADIDSKTQIELGDGSTWNGFVKHGPFYPPSTADSFTVEYPDNVTEVYKYRVGGVSGTILKTVTITYVNSSKNLISSGVIS